MGEARSSRPNSRERIETRRSIVVPRHRRQVPPGLTAGSGLKHGEGWNDRERSQGSSRPNSRERIETSTADGTEAKPYVPPGLTAGSGLKPWRRVNVERAFVFLPA